MIKIHLILLFLLTFNTKFFDGLPLDKATEGQGDEEDEDEETSPKPNAEVISSDEDEDEEEESDEDNDFKIGKNEKLVDVSQIDVDPNQMSKYGIEPSKLSPYEDQKSLPKVKVTYSNVNPKMLTAYGIDPQDMPKADFKKFKKGELEEEALSTPVDDTNQRGPRNWLRPFERKFHDKYFVDEDKGKPGHRSADNGVIASKSFDVAEDSKEYKRFFGSEDEKKELNEDDDEDIDESLPDGSSERSSESPYKAMLINEPEEEDIDEEEESKGRKSKKTKDEELVAKETPKPSRKRKPRILARYKVVIPVIVPKGANFDPKKFNLEDLRRSLNMKHIKQID